MLRSQQIMSNGNKLDKDKGISVSAILNHQK
jgi:hypothetical protein